MGGSPVRSKQYQRRVGSTASRAEGVPRFQRNAVEVGRHGTARALKAAGLAAQRANELKAVPMVLRADEEKIFCTPALVTLPRAAELDEVAPPRVASKSRLRELPPRVR